MMSIDLNRSKVVKAKVMKSLLFFTRYFFKETQGKKFIVSEHHQLIAKKLNEVARGECTRLIINIAPRFGKTELGVKNFIAWGLALNPSSKWIHLSYSQTLALDNSEAVKDLVNSDAYQELFPNVQIKKDSKSKEKWYTTQGGGVLARATGGQITGFGAGAVEDSDMDEFVLSGAIIIDDPIKPDDALSDVIRTKINERFDTTIRSRTNSRNTPIVIIMQRLHPNDLVGHLLEVDGDEWEVLSLPAIKEDGTPLWEFKMNLDDAMKFKRANEHVFETQYMQNPQPKDGLLFDKLQLFSSNQVDLNQYDANLCYIDVADTGEDNHAVIFGKLIEDRVYIYDVVFTKEATETNTILTADAINRNKPEYVWTESNFGGTMYNQLLNNLGINKYSQLIAMKESTNKHSRIIASSGFITHHFYFLDESERSDDYTKFIGNLKQYTKKKGAVKHDDAPDVASGLTRQVLNNFGYLFDEVFTEVE